jgi:hypothetical protein
MNIPRFTAEASLCKTSGHYQTGSHAINLPTQGGSAIYAAMMEVINIHDCAPGGILHDQGPLGWWCDYGGGGGGGPGGGGPNDGPNGGPPDGPGGDPPPEPAGPKPPKTPHKCWPIELKGSERWWTKAQADCKKQKNWYLECETRPGQLYTAVSCCTKGVGFKTCVEIIAPKAQR